MNRYILKQADSNVLATQFRWESYDSTVFTNPREIDGKYVVDVEISDKFSKVNTIKVADGDWIISDAVGEVSHLTNERFTQLFTPAPSKENLSKFLCTRRDCRDLYASLSILGSLPVRLTAKCQYAIKYNKQQLQTIAGGCLAKYYQEIATKAEGAGLINYNAERAFELLSEDDKKAIEDRLSEYLRQIVAVSLRSLDQNKEDLEVQISKFDQIEDTADRNKYIDIFVETSTAINKILKIDPTLYTHTIL